jgi:probable rRNA maturation factor
MTIAPGRRAAAPSIDIQIQSPLWDAQPKAGETVRQAVTAAAQALSTSEGEVAILLTDDASIRALNRQWRGIDQPTNVLSFPAAVTQTSAAAKFFGDIVLSYETLVNECADEDRIFLHHLAHLAVHGFLHLIGYDHQVDSEADQMEAVESRIMMRLKLPDPYRAHDLARDA